MLGRCCSWVSLVSLLASLLPMGVVRGVTTSVLPLQFHVAEREGRPVADADFLASQVSHARRVFAPVGVDFLERERLTLPAEHAELVSRRDRDALDAYLTPYAIHCMIVATLMDVDEPGRVRRGVHWTSRRDPSKHFVIVSAISGPYVLAHELGHFLGNREHSETKGNIMSYQLTDVVPFFDQTQAERISATVQALLSAGALKTVQETASQN